MSRDQRQPKQLFVAAAKPRNAFFTDQKIFLVQATSHREAWAVAREATRTGRGAYVRDVHDHELLHTYAIPPGEYVVEKVLTAERTGRGRPPKITTDDLMNLARRRGVKIPARLREAIMDELRE